jgi:hypothetical protein
MSGVEVTPCCCQENRPCCVTIVREASQCTCLQKGPECPNSVLCEPQPPRPVIQDRFVRCVGSADECDQLAQEYCQQNPNTISCSGTYYQQLTCDQIADAECDPIPFKVCQTYECGWCEPIVTECYVDYTDNPCPGPPTCTPDPCCDPEPPALCCCIDMETQVRQVVPCPDPIPPNQSCIPITNPDDCFNCGVYYTPIPGSSNCCSSAGNCSVAWDLSGCSYRPGCTFNTNNPPINYCSCGCWPCEYCSTDLVAIQRCIDDAYASGHNPDFGPPCFCPARVTRLCGPGCDPVNPLTSNSEQAAKKPVQNLESGVVLGVDSKPAVNTLFLLGYGTFNL